MTTPIDDVGHWSRGLSDRIRDLNNLIVEAQQSLLVYPRKKGSLDQNYNHRLIKIISAIQDLRDEIGQWKADEEKPEFPWPRSNLPMLAERKGKQ